jgi:hypothetical protein
MITIVRHGMHDIDVAPLLVEALNALPFIRPLHAPLFQRLFIQNWDTGIAERLILNQQLPKDFFSDIGGYSEQEALGAIVKRVTFGIFREANAREIERHRTRGYFTHAKCFAAPSYTCRPACAMDGVIATLDSLTTFPLPECDADWCACSWRFLLPREAIE